MIPRRASFAVSGTPVNRTNSVRDLDKTLKCASFQLCAVVFEGRAQLKSNSIVNYLYSSLINKTCPPSVYAPRPYSSLSRFISDILLHTFCLPRFTHPHHLRIS